jgi:hypothetical protein
MKRRIKITRKAKEDVNSRLAWELEFAKACLDEKEKEIANLRKTVAQQSDQLVHKQELLNDSYRQQSRMRLIQQQEANQQKGPARFFPDASKTSRLGDFPKYKRKRNG